MSLASQILALGASEPAGGAAIGQVVIATAGAAVGTAVLLWVTLGHRNGNVRFLGRLGDFGHRVSGLPPWAVVPIVLATVSLITALLGMMWDISLHIDNGRDAGPLANPAHYLILAGLFGVFSAGVLAIAMPRSGERPGPAPVRLAPSWHAPIGGILIAACGGFALTGFPLDDVWHRLFGQDVTLWGPTHLMLIGGAGMTLVGIAVLIAEGLAGRDDEAQGIRLPLLDVQVGAAAVVWVRRMGLMGGFLIGLSVFQAEFDFGVQQFRQVHQPLLESMAAGGALVAARLWIGRWGALGAWAFYFVLRGLIALTVGEIFGQSMPAQPLYLGSALAIEVAALLLPRLKPLQFGILAGVLIGTLGFATEWAWTHVVMPLPWNGDLMPEGLILAVIGGVAGGIGGSLLAAGMNSELPPRRVARTALVTGSLAFVVALGWALHVKTPEGIRAHASLQDVPGSQAREVTGTFRLDPPDAAEGASWLNVTSWQGGGLVVQKLKRTGPGTYRTTEPIPVHDDWKSLVRLHRGSTMVAMPIYLPRDRAIPVGEVPARAEFTRSFTSELHILQRERKRGVSDWLSGGAHMVVLALYVAFFLLISWGVGRLGRATEPPRVGRSDARVGLVRQPDVAT